MERWLATPHVAAWWREPLDLSGLEVKYAPRIDGFEPVHVFIVEKDGAPIGWVQWYRWADFPAHAAQLGADDAAAGLDLAIGEPDQIGMGLGPKILLEFVSEIAHSNPSMRSVICDPETRNRRSIRAFDKAGFKIIRTVQLPGEEYLRAVVRLDVA